MKDRSQSSSIQTRRSSRAANRSAGGQVWTVEQVVSELKGLGNPRNVQGMARFGIRQKIAFGVSKPQLDELARRVGRNQELSLALWRTGIHDARIFAGKIGERRCVSARQMNQWVKDFDSWDVCDGTCCHLFAFAEPAWEMAREWTGRKAEFEKRAGFALAAYLACHDKKAPDSKFREYLKLIEGEAWDDRNFVRKAANWALRNIGKRNLPLNRAAIASAKRIQRQGTKSARWIAADALRELTSDAVQSRLARSRG